MGSMTERDAADLQAALGSEFEFDPDALKRIQARLDRLAELEAAAATPKTVTLAPWVVRYSDGRSKIVAASGPAEAWARGEELRKAPVVSVGIE